MNFSESTTSFTRTMKFKLIIIGLSFATALACPSNVPLEFLNGCGFETLAIVNPSSGFVVTDENCGLEVDKGTFCEQPFVFYYGATDCKKYLLVMVDNDDPTVEVGKSYLQWLVVNIDGASLKHGLGINVGNTIAGNNS